MTQFEVHYEANIVTLIGLLRIKKEIKIQIQQ